MKTTRWVTGLIVAGLVAATAGAKEGAEKSEAYYVVKTSGMAKQIDTEVMSESELRDLEKTLKLEQKHFTKALNQAAKEWSSDEMNKGVMFPGSMLKPRAIVSSMKYASSDKAMDKLASLESGDSKKGVKKKASRQTAKPTNSKRADSLGSAADLVKSKLEALIAGAPAAAPAAHAAPAAAPAKIDAGGAQNAVKAVL